MAGRPDAAAAAELAPAESKDKDTREKAGDVFEDDDEFEEFENEEWGEEAVDKEVLQQWEDDWDDDDVNDDFSQQLRAELEKAQE